MQNLQNQPIELIQGHTRTTCLNPQISVVYYKNPRIPLLASANKPSRPIHCQPITPQPIKASQINSKATE